MKKLHSVFFIVLVFFGCSTNPLTGEKTMAFINNRTLFPMSFSEYDDFLNDPAVKVVKRGDRSFTESDFQNMDMVTRVGEKLATAAQKWLEDAGDKYYLKDYKWEYNLVKDNQVNAWCMPGGKIVVYTGILPVTQNEDALAVVLGHEISHALLNHGQQRMSAGLLQQLGALVLGLAVSGQSETTQGLLLAAYSVGTTVGGMLPFSRSNESEADKYGLFLMTIAGYTPEESVPFWQRMAALSGGGGLEFLSTHPDSGRRSRELEGWIPEAKQKAAKINGTGK